MYLVLAVQFPAPSTVTQRRGTEAKLERCWRVEEAGSRLHLGDPAATEGHGLLELGPGKAGGELTLLGLGEGSGQVNAGGWSRQATRYISSARCRGGRAAADGGVMPGTGRRRRTTVKQGRCAARDLGTPETTQEGPSRRRRGALRVSPWRREAAGMGTWRERRDLAGNRRIQERATR